jgi:xyloglucan fucosyltransferase
MTHASPINETEFNVCPSGVSRARNVPFVSIKDSDLYFGVGFFLNPALASILDVLFPERNPFHVLSKYLFSPSDQVWERVRHYLDGSLSSAARRIGVQIREFTHGYTDAYDSSIPACIRRKAAFSPVGLRKTKKMHADDYFSVYVATLAQDHIAKLNQSLPLLGNETGKNFKIAWQQVDKFENHDNSHQQEALVDMWVLSLSDVLLTSGRSTFGYVAQGLGGLVPYLINTSKDQICEASIGTDPCYHRAPNEVVCNEEKVSVRELLNQSLSVKYCPDFIGGWQLVLPF